MSKINDGNDDSPLLRVSGLKKHFDQSEGFIDKLLGSGGIVRAVDGADLTVEVGETLGVVGESGCGKSTLGQSVLNLHTPSEGVVEFRGTDIAGLSDREMRPYRRDLQMIFQDPLASLNPRQTIGEILKAPMEVHDIGESDEERTKRAKELLERVGLKAGHLDRHPHQFSGGQQQRVGIARALTVDPDLIIADEPVSALDVSVQAQIINLLDELQDEFGLAMIFIAHDLSVIRNVADRVAVMYLGEIVETAPVEELFESPQHPYTESLLSSIPRINPEDRKERILLEGTVPSPLDPPSGCRFRTRCPAIIPHSEWAAGQSEFRSVYSFKNKILNGELDIDAIETRLQAEDVDLSEESLKDRLLRTALDCDLSRLPDEVAATVEEIIEHVIDRNEEAAVSVATEAFPSPCEEQPSLVKTSEQRGAVCHRVDPESEWCQNWRHK